MNHSDAQRERRRAGPSPSLAQSEPAYGRGTSAGRLEGYEGLEDVGSASEFEPSWHLWFLIVAAMGVAAMVLAVLTFQPA
ncbi:hypothetical protein J5J86_07850 [Aquabacter sp. L1I39]|uniref:hypothetical protein n=1 Tax=Aquabacter sp. L1I39 TaxID=2820278 RepID=UPI001ADC41D0|nr:hypothetical protein [Aquabacter sp. L1I39]QTL05192.1 hypothetical protein J5J86_07850 [Aquabacter sp. L1I39]